MRRSGLRCAGFLLGTVACWAQMLPNGTKISCRLEQSISSATADEGQQVQLSVTEAVRIGDAVVIPQGAQVLGSIILAQEKRRMGRAGKLDFSIDKVRAADGEYIPLRYTMRKKEGGGSTVSTGVMTGAAAVLFWPAAPFFLLRKGKDVTINKGIVVEVFTDQDHTMRASAVSSTPVAPASSGAAPTSTAAMVKITSDVPGAEIEVDGAFVGSTPTTRQMIPGSHVITVRHGSKVWTRTLNVQSGEVSVNAILSNAK